MANSKNKSKKPVKKSAPKKKAVKKKVTATVEPPKITADSLKEVVRFHLSNFNDENVEINDETVLNTALSATDGFGTSNSQDIFRYVIEGTFKMNGFPVPAFPESWMTMNVSEFVSALLQTT